ncbi:MAG: hypothetical protein ACI97A_000550 [Planctomycetota bacterium]|jgi:uncharacterized protein (DUF1501 family)
MNLKETLNNSDPFSRRAFLGGAARGLLGVGLMPMMGGFSNLLMPQEEPIVLGPATAKNVIYLFMKGGMSHLDTFDLKPGAESQGPTKAISTNVDGMLVSEHMPALAKHMDKVAVINSMFSNQGAHVTGRYLMHTSYVARGTIKHPSMGAWLGHLSGRNNNTLPGHVVVGEDTTMATNGFMSSEYAPLPIGDAAQGLSNGRRHKNVDQKTFAKRMSRLEMMNKAFSAKHGSQSTADYDKMYKEAVKLMSSSDLAAFDISQEDDLIKKAYGSDPFAQGCLLARRLIEHDVRYVEVVLNGWDTHNENFDALETQVPKLDRALACLLADLEVRGLLNDTMVVLGTEFGRTPEINAGRNGRDHYPRAFSCLLAGGGIKGGVRWGKTDEFGAQIVENKVTVQDFNATIAHGLGLPLEHRVFSPTGRPFQVADKGKPVLQLFA